MRVRPHLRCAWPYSFPRVRESRWQRLRRFAVFAPAFRAPGILRVESPQAALSLGVSFQLPRLHSPALHLVARQARRNFNPRPLPGVKQLVRFCFPVAHNDSRSAACAKPSSHREGLKWRGFLTSGSSNPRKRTPGECPDPHAANVTGNWFVPDSANSAMPCEVQRSVKSAGFRIAATRH